MFVGVVFLCVFVFVAGTFIVADLLSMVCVAMRMIVYPNAAKKNHLVNTSADGAHNTFPQEWSFATSALVAMLLFTRIHHRNETSDCTNCKSITE